ncbi:RagB/SusD family nutrient uptake outer membrane protein [Negadavirga shengliensis]|uniref:RagB/SusD family nutrient uptake outer membrane protein n=1 Tax=Negadavirga shengliensis TaxID=1389218 RepID=A0ABV9T3D3_9BACT
MKNITTYQLTCLLLLAFAAFTVSCSDEFLEKNPKAELTSESFWQTEEQAVQAVNATYSHLRNWGVHVFSYLGVTDIASDDATKGSVPGDSDFLNEVNNFTHDANNTAIIGLWGAYYQGIFRANQVIVNVPEMDIDPDLRERLVAEARFLRGYFYFFLTRVYGDLPLVAHPLDPDEYTQERVPREQIFDFIIADFEFAAAHLPEKSGYPAADLGRVTRGAAHGFLARLYLFQNDFENVYAHAMEVINSGEYSLHPDYLEIFREAGEHSSESVFEVSKVALEQGGGGSQFNQVQGIRGDPNRGWGFNSPSDDLIAAYEEGDPRLEATVIFNGDTLESGEIVRAVPGMGPNARFNRKAHLPEMPPIGTQNSGANIRLMRYADILLMAAEAANELGNSSEALTYLNMVRERARQGDPDVLPDVTTTSQGELREAIWHERRVELAMEQQRYFDIVRQGRAQEIFANLGINWMPNRHEIFPIPQAEIDISGGVLTQNPGY